MSQQSTVAVADSRRVHARVAEAQFASVVCYVRTSSGIRKPVAQHFCKGWKDGSVVSTRAVHRRGLNFGDDLDSLTEPASLDDSTTQCRSHRR